MKLFPHPYGLRNPHCRNLKSENSQDYVQKPQRNCTFMISASVDVKQWVNSSKMEDAKNRSTS
jgi:hypothetical protein